MKTRFLAGSALAAFAFSSSAVALDIRLGGNAEFIATQGDMISNSGTVGSYTDDVVSDVDLNFITKADVTVKADYKTRKLDYGVFVNFDFDQNASTTSLQNTDVDSHIRVRFSHGTFKFGTDIDGLQNAEDLDWVTKGPISFSNSISAPQYGHEFSHSVQKASTVNADATELTAKVTDSSLTFMTNTFNGFTLAGEVTPSGADTDWGASAKYVGNISSNNKMTAVIATDSAKAQLLNVKMEFGDIALNGFMGKDDDHEKYEGGALAYDMGALSVSGGMIQKEAQLGASGTTGARAEQKDILVGAAYTLAPGLTVDGSYIKEERTDLAATTTLEAERLQGRVKLKF